MTDTENPVYQMINSIRERIRQSLYDGDLDYNAAFRTLRHHMTIAKEMNHLLLAGQLEEMMGTIEMEYGRFAAAEGHMKQSLSYFETIDDQMRILIMSSNLGEVYRRWGKPDEAAACYERARTIAEEQESLLHEAITYNNEGLLWTEHGEAERALPLLEKALELTRTLPLDLFAKIILSEVHNGLARNHLKQNNYAQAWQLARDALRYAQESHRMPQIAAAYVTLAQLAVADPDSADEQPATFFNHAREHYQRANANAEIATMLMIEADYWQQQGDHIQARRCYSQAIEHFEKAHLDEKAQIARTHIEKMA